MIRSAIQKECQAVIATPPATGTCYPRHRPCHFIRWDGTKAGPAGITAIREMAESGVAVSGDVYGKNGLASICGESGQFQCFATGDYVIVDWEGQPIVTCSAEEFERWFEVAS